MPRRRGEPTDADRQRAQRMLARLEAGDPKSRIEADEFGDSRGHGKRVSAFIRWAVGIETETPSPQTQRLAVARAEVRNLQARLELHGESVGNQDPSQQALLLSASRRAAMAAIRAYNDPTGTFRTETYLTHMTIAWNTLCQSRILRVHGEIFEREADGTIREVNGLPRVRDFTDLVSEALPDPEFRAVRENLLFLYRLRGRIEHHFVPEIDLLVSEHIQAMLVNYEHLLTEEGGEVASLGRALAIPLYLSELAAQGVPNSVAELESGLPPDVLQALRQLRADIPDDVLEDPSFAVRIHLIATTANRESQAERVIHFIDAATANEDQKQLLEQLAVVTKIKHQAVSGRGLLKPGAVSSAVAAAIPWHFNASSHHARAWKYFNVRPAAGSAEPERTEARYCIYDEPSGEYRYTRAWVRLLASELTEASRFEEITGIVPTPKAATP